MITLAERLANEVRRAELWEPIDERRVRCYACGHCCPVFDGQAGVCKVRFNRGGTLWAPWGYVQSLQCDPVEKKPFFHVRPGATALSFGMLGCDLHCAYCQNWLSSQVIRDPGAIASWRRVTPPQLVGEALRCGAEIIVSTYNEPLITAEWSAAVFREAKTAGLITGFVSNGNATPQVLEYLRPSLDLYKVDLKSFNDRCYRDLGGRLQPVLDSIRQIHAMGFWLEVVTLLVPGLNDSEAEMRSMASFLAGISPDIPWHVTAFHPDYKLLVPAATPPETLLRAARIGVEEGLRFVYAGNQPHRVGTWENTRCPNCGITLVERTGFRVLANRLNQSCCCHGCGQAIAGRWLAPHTVRRSSHNDM